VRDRSSAQGAGDGAPSRALHDQVDTTGLGARPNTHGVDMTMKTEVRPRRDHCEVRLSTLRRAFHRHLGWIMSP
jgi:hypothetical protein